MVLHRQADDGARASRVVSTPHDSWPSLALHEWRDTYATLHMWTQIVGKTRLALAPMVNHWWHVVLYVSTRGLTTSPMPWGERTVEVELDFISHDLVVRTSDGDTCRMPLRAEPVAGFYHRYLELLRSLDITPKIRPRPVEVVESIPFAEDRVHASYDGDAAQRCWRVLVQSDRVMQQFRGRFTGKCSPVHFFWGGFDLACTRFSGRPAPTHPGGVPNCPDYVQVEAYSRECISAGWWPGSVGGAVEEPAFYAYAYPEPPGSADAPIRPAAAHYHPVMREWILPYEAVRQAPNPDEAVMAFLESTYEVGATLGGWERSALERPV